ncbi:hypothetical protein D9M68_402470 [compost metagenome]
MTTTGARVCIDKYWFHTDDKGKATREGRELRSHAGTWERYEHGVTGAIAPSPDHTW